MLAFERRVVTAMLTSDDPRQRAETLQYVDGALGELPEVIRTGVWGESVALGTWFRLRDLAGKVDDRSLVQSLEANPIGPVRQYVRLLRSLVLFAEEEGVELAGRAISPAGAREIRG